jgi:tetratricopeptide (TPR) repeat protein
MGLPGVPEVRRSFGVPRGIGPSVHPLALATAAWIVVAPQLFAGVFPWTVIAISVCGLVCLALAAFDAQLRAAGSTSLLTLVVCACLAMTVLQCVPLPCGFVAHLAPNAVAHVEEAAHALGRGRPELCTLSQDPGRTREEVLKGTAIVASFLCAWLLSTGGKRMWVLWSVAASTLAMALVALAHGVLALDAVFGVYEPHGAKRVILLAPIMNQNNLGGFLAMGVPLWLGLSSRIRSFQLRLYAYGAFVVLVAAVVLTLSRGAIAVVVAGGAVMGGVLLLRARRIDPRKQRFGLALLGALVVGALALGVVISVTGHDRTADVAGEFQRGGWDKLELIAQSFTLVRDHPWIGVGRGAFSSVFTARHGSLNRFENPENLVAQWASEWGVPLTALLLGCILVALRRPLSRAAGTPRVGAAVAVLALGGQNLLDFGLEHVGVAVVASALLAATVVPSGRGRRTRTTPRWRRPSVSKTVRTLAMVTAVALTWIAPEYARSSVRDIDTLLRTALEADDRTAFRAALVRGLELHPNEPVFVLLAATEGVRHDDPAAERYIQLALRRAPGWAAPHVVAAEWALKREQLDRLRRELHTAASIDEASVGRMLCAVMWRHPNLVFEAAPTNSRRFRYLEVASGCLPAHTSAAESVDRYVLREYPTARQSRQRQVERLLKAGRLEDALAQLDAALAAGGPDGYLQITRANLLVQAGRPQEALATVLDAELKATTPSARSELARTRLRVAVALRDAELVGAAALDLRALAGFDPEALAGAYAAEGDARRSLGALGAALHAFEEANRIHRDTAYLRSIAQASETLGDRRRALAAYREVCAMTPADLDACAKREALSGLR